MQMPGTLKVPGIFGFTAVPSLPAQSHYEKG